MLSIVEEFQNLQITSSERWNVVLGTILIILCMIILLIIVDVLAKKVLLKLVGKITKKTTSKWDDYFYERRVFHKLAHIPTALLLYFFAEFLELTIRIYAQRLIAAYMIVLALLFVFALLDGFGDIYKTFKFANTKPITGFLQVGKILATILACIVLVSVFMGTATVIALMGTLGGMTVFIVLIFSDSILGLVASTQLTADDALKIGDWIDMPSQEADGEVMEISLSKVKVKNWDMTITNIPTQNFIKQPFKNWRGISEAGGRRIKRAILINVNSIRFVDDELIKQLSKISFLETYIEEKEKDIHQHNLKMDLRHVINGRKQTNLGLFRAYLENYLKHNAGIHPDFTIMVRQLAPSDKGLPLEIYCFSKDINWVNYEAIQSDLFDHIYAVIGFFDLKPFQSISIKPEVL